MNQEPTSLYLALGCFGRRDDCFISCGGVENKILEINNSLHYYNDIMDYFEGVRLFDKPMFDLNGVRHIIYNMQNRYDQGMKRLWSEKDHRLYEKFMLRHKDCGVFLKLLLDNKDIINSEDNNETSHKIEGTPEPIIKIPELRVIRGRR